MTENCRKVFDYLMAHDGEDFTAADMASQLDLSIPTVNGCVTSGLARKGLAERIEAEAETEDGKVKKVKLIKLTDAGRAFDPDAADEQ